MILFDICDEKDLHKTEQLYFFHKDLLFSLAYEILQKHSLAEEAVQETFIKAIKHLQKIEDIKSGKARNFLAIICKNTALDILRREKKSLPADDFEPFSEENNFESLIIGKETVRSITRLTKELDEKYRNVLYFKITFDMSNKEIAQALSISEELVKKRMQRARRILLEKIREEELL